MKKKALIAAALALSLLLLTACGTATALKPITDMNDLQGRRVGVGLAWSADYVLTPRDGKDLQLLRYDSMADALMALCYRQLDAVAADEVDFKLMQQSAEGLQAYEEPITMDSYIAYFAPDREDLCLSLNEFLASYKETERYASLLQRLDEYDGTNYAMPEPLRLTGTGEKIRVGYCIESFPLSFSTAEGEPQGFLTELMADFFNEKNYDVELLPTGEADMYIGIANGSYDMVFGYISDAYREEAELIGLNPSDPCLPNPVYLIYIPDRDSVYISEDFYE